MTALLLAPWVLRRALGHPIFPPLALALIGLVFLMGELTPLGTVSQGDPQLRLVCAWLFPAGCLGVALGLSILGEGEGFLALLPPGGRWGGELVALVSLALLLQLPVLAAGLLSGGAAIALRLAAGGAEWGLSVLHTAALGLLVLRLPATPLVRTLGLLALVWLLPAALHVWAPRPLALEWSLDPGHHLRGTPPFAMTPKAALLAMASTVGLLGLSRLLPTPAPARPIGP